MALIQESLSDRHKTGAFETQGPGEEGDEDVSPSNPSAITHGRPMPD